MYVEGRFFEAALAFGFQHFDPHRVEEHLYRVCGIFAFVFWYPGDSILDELCCRFISPSVLDAFGDRYWAVAAEAFDREKDCGAFHFGGGDTEGYVLGGPDGLLCKNLIVDWAQGVNEEGGGQTFCWGFACSFSFLSCVLVVQLRYDFLEVFFFHWQGYSICFGLSYLAYCIKDSVANFIVEFWGFRIAPKWDGQECFTFHCCPFIKNFLLDVGIGRAGIGVMDSRRDASGIFIKWVFLRRAVHGDWSL